MNTPAEAYARINPCAERKEDLYTFRARDNCNVVVDTAFAKRMRLLTGRSEITEDDVIRIQTALGSGTYTENELENIVNGVLREKSTTCESSRIDLAYVFVVLGAMVLFLILWVFV